MTISDRVPLTAAAQRLALSVRTLSRAKRLALGLVDMPPPPGGEQYAWVSRESVDLVAAQRAALRRALHAVDPASK